MDDQFSLFQNKSAPLAYRSRPETFDHYKGQKHLSPLIAGIKQNNPPHIVFSGPPGSGKTTLAHVLARHLDLKIYPFNAVMGGVKDLRVLIDRVTTEVDKCIIFIDEIHRFNKAQQDALLPHLEKGDFVLFGATTESPKVTLNKAIISRIKLWYLNKLEEENIQDILDLALVDAQKELSPDLVDYLAKISNGDARYALNQLETLLDNFEEVQKLNLETIKQKFLSINRTYDKDSERHYDVISAFIKSIRGSDASAALLWLAVMIEGGEDIEFIARRLIISASEDVGNADPRALQVATNAHYGIKTIGMPEARIILAQATTYLANAPKSNASYLGINKAMAFVKENPMVEVPTHLRNHHPHKKNYKYPHSYNNHYVPQQYHGENQEFYESSNIAYEKMQEAYLKKIKE